METTAGNSRLMDWGRALLEELGANDFRAGQSTSNNIGVMLQPASYSERGSHQEFAAVLDKFSFRDDVRRMDLARVWAFILNVKKAVARTDGAIAELGVYRGHSSALLSHYAEQYARTMYLIDTFTGFSDEQLERGQTEDVKEAFRDTSLDSARETVGDYFNNRWIIGRFPDCVTEDLENERFCFVSIDTDLYAPIMDGLKFFYPRLNDGGVILVHDYSSELWPGATDAVDDFCNEMGLTPVLLPDFGGSAVLTRLPRSAQPESGRKRRKSSSLDRIAALKSELATVQAYADERGKLWERLDREGVALSEAQALAAERAQKMDALQATVTEVQALAAQRTRQIDELQNALDDAQELAIRRVREINRLQTALDNVQSTIITRTTQLHRTQTALEEAQRLAADRAVELGKVYAALETAQKLAIERWEEIEGLRKLTKAED